MTINARNRIILLLLISNIVAVALLAYWISSVRVSLDLVATTNIMGSMLLALAIFLSIYLLFPKTNAPELMVLLSYALGLALQGMRLLLFFPLLLSEQSLQIFGLSLAIFGYFLALSSLLFMSLVELGAIKIHIDAFLLYYAMILYIFILHQPIQTLASLESYLLPVIDPYALTLLRTVLSGLTGFVLLLLLWSKDDAQKPYFAATIILLILGLRTTWLTPTLIGSMVGFLLQALGLSLLFILIRRRYLWFRWT
ncbi:hypothetical protein [Entomospira culicis]|uniref:Uncharacterized protein n=1 Tax=Entomospira culicis TaxID=2719989 RepID=A0A968KTT6_9SPIO|nr:hypothetical protein [Entomospira culicis]NIZ18579.1 hypothetical protein [Entomospira culicis]NIZ68794.1 hypothetical protein [Entomospira culicis]WDI37390.1 hypothetical protein PVA46_00970 [Entomospira culicis]WDI39019.1 hypothetical protein PVA47_00980 [Entomospira culicis]